MSTNHLCSHCRFGAHSSPVPSYHEEFVETPVPRIFRASGPNRIAVVLEALRLVRTHRCAVRVLAGKVFDHQEYSVVADILGNPASRARLAQCWEGTFQHEISKTGVRQFNIPSVTAGLGTHLVEAVGPGHGTPIDVLDLVSGEFNVPINVVFIRRAARCHGFESRYCVQIVIDLPFTTRAQALCRQLKSWGTKPDCQIRIIPLLCPPGMPEAMPSELVPCGPGGPLAHRVAIERELVPADSAVDGRAYPNLNFPGGVDYV